MNYGLLAFYESIITNLLTAIFMIKCMAIISKLERKVYNFDIPWKLKGKI